ncbi:hypothetical protein GW17_00033787 [Ensete ventricosum]|nr:hypothetical protein GW17_00033787 [Ensete ventricosum]
MVAATAVGATVARVGVQVLLSFIGRYYCYNNRSRCASTTALYGAILLCVLLLLIEPPVSPLSDKGSFPPPLPPVPPCLNPTFHDKDKRAMEREEPSSLPLVVIATVLLLLIVPPISPLSYEGPFPPSLPPIPPPCLNAMFHDKDSAIVA